MWFLCMRAHHHGKFRCWGHETIRKRQTVLFWTVRNWQCNSGKWRSRIILFWRSLRESLICQICVRQFIDEIDKVSLFGTAQGVVYEFTNHRPDSSRWYWGVVILKTPFQTRDHNRFPKSTRLRWGTVFPNEFCLSARSGRHCNATKDGMRMADACDDGPLDY